MITGRLVRWALRPHIPKRNTLEALLYLFEASRKYVNRKDAAVSGAFMFITSLCPSLGLIVYPGKYLWQGYIEKEFMLFCFRCIWTILVGMCTVERNHKELPVSLVCISRRTVVKETQAGLSLRSWEN